MDTPEALWAAWRKGDGRAFERLYAELRPGLYRLCLALTRRTPIPAEDLFQESFRRAIASAATYQGACSLRTWLAVIARHAFLDQVRQGRRQAEAAVPVSPETDPASGIPALAVELLDQLATLPEEQREAIALRFLQGLGLEEVAETLDISLATVKRRITDGLDRLAGKA